MLTAAQAKQFHENGFLNIGRVLSDDDCALLKSELFKVMNHETERKPVLNRNLTGRDDAVVVQIVNIWEASDAYLDLAKHPVITEAVAHLCNTDTLRIWHDQIQYKPAKAGGPTGWHQDHPLWPSIQPADLISAWIPMEDATLENGCMRMVPGSHKWGNQQRFIGTGEAFAPIHREPSQLPDGAELNAVPTEVLKGECHLHHSLTWHGSPDNTSEKERPAIAIHFMPGHTLFQPVGRHPMDEFITVPEGTVLAGDHFPVVYQRGRKVA
ncbi:MAG: phytanoyl-CoA dioxygenase family protein [Candidatus Poribacteria bacterium]|nr:phytanoyl-CoA dioxygenase family protein [Candidatus Poribacteria bacterium]